MDTAILALVRREMSEAFQVAAKIAHSSEGAAILAVKIFDETQRREEVAKMMKREAAGMVD